MKAIVRLPGEGETASLGATTIRFLAQQADVEAVSVTEASLAPGFPGARPHTHARTYDVYYVLEGTVLFLLGDDEISAPVGSFVLVPPGVRHMFSNPGHEPARILNVNHPAGLEQYLKEAAELPAVDPAAMAEIAAKYDVTPAG
jgi:mannose-6-phosphate isomerase-like protein (cupin superfamily)